MTTSISNGQQIYEQKVLKNCFITMKQFKEVKEYLKNNASKEEILKVANHYADVYKNCMDKSGIAASLYKSYELSLKKLA